MEIEKVVEMLGRVPPTRARQIVRAVFGEMLAQPWVGERERAHLEQRRLEVLERLRPKRAA